MQFRDILPADNPAVATLIRTVMTEFGAVGEGYSIQDPEVDQMFEAYNNPRSRFFVLVEGNSIVGCGGIGPLANAEEDICELKKMYFYPQARGLGLGRELLFKCLGAARQIGYKHCYLETIAAMDRAARLYQKAGFQALSAPKGNTGHSACNSWYIMDLTNSPTSGDGN